MTFYCSRDLIFAWQEDFDSHVFLKFGYFYLLLKKRNKFVVIIFYILRHLAFFIYRFWLILCQFGRFYEILKKSKMVDPRRRIQDGRSNMAAAYN